MVNPHCGALMTPPAPGDFSANIVFLITVIGACGALWWRIEAAIKSAKNEAMTQAAAAAALATLAQSQLSAHKLHVAETYITKAGLRETTEQVLSAVAAVKADVHGLNERIDRIIEDHQAAATPRPRRSA